MRIKPLPALFSLTLAASAQATVLTFDNGDNSTPTLCSFEISGGGPLQNCSNGTRISQSYGDQAGLLDVRYDTPRATAGVDRDWGLHWWDFGYNNLTGVLWAGTDDSNSLARIDLATLQAGRGVRLNGFDLGAYPNTTRGTTVEVRDLLTDDLLWSDTGNVGVSTAGDNVATAFAPSVYSVNGLRIEWRDSAFNVGIDNLDFTLDPPAVNGVPEPAAAFWWVGLAAAGVSWRRRRAA